MRDLAPVSCCDLKLLNKLFSMHGHNFDSDLILASAKRCKHGFIQVLMCKSLDARGKPFPTNFWLSCPYLIYQAGKIESQNGVHELENYLNHHNKFNEWQNYNRLHQFLRLNIINNSTKNFLRTYRPKIFKSIRSSGIGGMRYNTGKINIKCLHLQTASFLALGFHPGGEWLIKKGLACESCESEKYCRAVKI